jgi:putative FmdB family regulatory protein
MAVYEYEHKGKGCRLGKVFEVEQSIKDAPLKKCPECGRPVKKLISAPALSLSRADKDLESKGFTKLVRREKGVYEDVTAKDGEKRIIKASDLE